MISWLNTVLFSIGSDHVSVAEVLGFITGGLCVALTARGSTLNFPAGIVNSAIFLVLFFSARLWADTGLQIIYIALGLLGWAQWMRSRRSRRNAAASARTTGQLIVRRMGWRELVTCTGFIVVGTAVLTVILSITHDSAPFLDALTTCLSLTAQWLLNTRRLENWYFWIVADVIYIPLYFSKGLTLTAAVYVLFLGLCVVGLRTWSKQQIRTQSPPQVTVNSIP